MPWGVHGMRSMVMLGAIHCTIVMFRSLCSNLSMLRGIWRNFRPLNFNYVSLKIFKCHELNIYILRIQYMLVFKDEDSLKVLTLNQAKAEKKRNQCKQW